MLQPRSPVRGCVEQVSGPRQCIQKKSTPGLTVVSTRWERLTISPHPTYQSQINMRANELATPTSARTLFPVPSCPPAHLPTPPSSPVSITSPCPYWLAFVMRARQYMNNWNCLFPGMFKWHSPIIFKTLLNVSNHYNVFLFVDEIYCMGREIRSKQLFQFLKTHFLLLLIVFSFFHCILCLFAHFTFCVFRQTS